jgi:hypothetical protein
MRGGTHAEAQRYCTPASQYYPAKVFIKSSSLLRRRHFAKGGAQGAIVAAHRPMGGEGHGVAGVGGDARLVPVAWLTDTTAKPVATERVSPDWVGREP